MDVFLWNAGDRGVSYKVLKSFEAETMRSREAEQTKVSVGAVGQFSGRRPESLVPNHLGNHLT